MDLWKWCCPAIQISVVYQKITPGKKKMILQHDRKKEGLGLENGLEVNISWLPKAEQGGNAFAGVVAEVIVTDTETAHWFWLCTL